MSYMIISLKRIFKDFAFIFVDGLFKFLNKFEYP